ncbi:hypothetical protein BpHYR1_009964 [Brachionus plicatilis]|uniref:Uncharacterized protein n=1 Tax=Brachionus plicatilis TaxID=10195 RepID=A0A3M7QJG4_BRAPC|nr:hypothetical protein BpHYR1_009964 [Brachionus plicatilis]
MLNFDHFSPNWAKVFHNKKYNEEQGLLQIQTDNNHLAYILTHIYHLNPDKDHQGKIIEDSNLFFRNSQNLNSAFLFFSLLIFIFTIAIRNAND